MNTAIALTFLLLTVLFTLFVTVLAFALLAAFEKVLLLSTQALIMANKIIDGGFEIEYETPDQEPQDNTGAITSRTEVDDYGNTKTQVTDEYFDAEFKDGKRPPNIENN